MLDFINKGVTGFRMDAALYVHPEATADMINQVHGSRPETKFLMELLVPREAVLHRMMVELKKLVTHSSKIFYFDFPQMYEIRRIQEQKDYHLSWLMGYLQNLNRIGMDRSKLVPTITNHDFGTAFADSGLEEIAFALSEFSSFHSNLLFPHLDRSNPHSKDNNRQVISGYQASKDSIGNLVGVFKKALEPYRLTKEIMANPDIWTGNKWVPLNDLSKDFIENYRSAEGRYGRDSLALKMSLEGRKLFLFVKKDDLPHTFHFHLRGESGEMKVLYQMNNPAVTLGDSIKIESNGRTVVLIEMN